MTVYTAPITQVGTEPARAPFRFTDVRYCLRIIFGPGQAIFIVSHDDVIPLLPAGAVYSKARLANVPMPDIARNAGFESGTATTPSTTYTIADVDDDVTKRFAEKNLNGEGTYNRIIEDYEFPAGGPFEPYQYLGANLNPNYTPPVYTGIIQNHDRTYNGVILETSDINRKVDDDVFEPLTWKLKDSITASSPTIQTTLPVGEIANYQLTWKQPAWALENAGKTGAYAKIGEEVFFYEKFEVINSVCMFTGVVRGQCKTESAAVKIESGTEDKNKPEIASYMVLQEAATDIPKIMMTGKSADGTVYPKNCHVGESIRWINEPSFAKHSSPLKLYFEISSKQKCRSFYEKEVLSLMSAVLGADGRGRLTWLPRQRPTDAGAGQIVLDESNCNTDTDLTLRHIKDDISPSIKINYEWSERHDKPLQSVTYRDTESEGLNNIADGQRLKEFTFKGLRTGIHTGTQLKKLAATFGDDYFFERLEFTIESYVNDIPLGALVSLDFENVKDDANGLDIRLKRTMLVTATNYSRTRRATTYTFSGTLQAQSKRQASNRLHNMGIEEYKRGKINIATLPGLVWAAPNIATGNITLQMGQSYYFVDDVNPGTGIQFASDMNITIAGKGPFVKIFVFGPIDAKAKLDFTGRSHHRRGVGQNQQGVAGSMMPESGYVLSTRSTGGIITGDVYGTRIVDDQPTKEFNFIRVAGANLPVSASGRYSSAPDPAINLNDGRIGGLPSDLGGTAGVGGPLSQRNGNIIAGSDGGDAGGGLILVSWGGSVENLILDGADGAVVNQANVYNNISIAGGAGGGGGPGSFLWIVDGNHAPPTMGPDNIKARYGKTSVLGNSLGAGDVIPSTPAALYRYSSDAVSSDVNHWQSVSRIAYTPEPEILQSSRPFKSRIEQFFDTQPDSNAKIIISDVKPSDGNVDDMWITQAVLDDTANKKPFFRVLRRRLGWQEYKWGVDDHQTFYASLIAFYREYGTMKWTAGPTQPVDFKDGEAWTNTLTGETWILRKDGKHELAKSGDTNVGDNHYSDGNFAAQQAANARDVAGPWIIDSKIRTPRLILANIIPEANNSDAAIPRAVEVYVYETFISVVISVPIAGHKNQGYRIYRNGVRIGPDIALSSRTYQDTSIVPGSQYRYSASAFDSQGRESAQKIGAPEVVTAQGGANTSLPDVSGLSAQIYGFTSGELLWTAPADRTRHNGYEVTRVDQGTGANPVVGTRTGAATSSYPFNDMVSGKSYTWTVKTVAADGSKSAGVSASGTAQ